jgi:hypothetical protein
MFERQVSCEVYRWFLKKETKRRKKIRAEECNGQIY